MEIDIKKKQTNALKMCRWTWIQKSNGIFSDVSSSVFEYTFCSIPRSQKPQLQIRFKDFVPPPLQGLLIYNRILFVHRKKAKETNKRHCL